MNQLKTKEETKKRVKSDSKVSWSPSGKECEAMEIGDVCAQATLLYAEKKKGEKRRNEEASFQIKTTFNYRRPQLC